MFGIHIYVFDIYIYIYFYTHIFYLYIQGGPPGKPIYLFSAIYRAENNITPFITGTIRGPPCRENVMSYAPFRYAGFDDESYGGRSMVCSSEEDACGAGMENV